MMNASKNLNIRVEEPSWMEIQDDPKKGDKSALFEKELDKLIKQSGAPQIVLILLKDPRTYASYKRACYNRNIISQVVS